MRYRKHEIAYPALASRPGLGARRAALGAAAVLLLAGTGGCTWFNFIPGIGHRSEIEAANPARPGDALSATREHMQLEPREPYWPFHLGELYAQADSTALAVHCLKSSLALDPGYAPAASLLSKIYFDAKMHNEAVTLLEGVLAHNAAAPDALRAALALNLEAIGEIDRAQAALDACTGDSRDAAPARALLSLRDAEPQQVLDTAKRALDADGKSAANHNNYGIALLCAGRPVEAREEFKTALELNDRLPGALYNMAIVETFYFFNDDAGRQWFARYRQYASEDPDNLMSRLETDVTRSDRARN